MKRTILPVMLAVYLLLFAFLPTTVRRVEGEQSPGGIITVGGNTDKVGTYTGSYLLMNVIPVKSVEVTVTPRKKLVPCGNSIGIKIETNGVIVVGSSDIYGSKSPMENAGLATGDIILRVNGKEVRNTEELRAIVSESNGEEVNFEINRNNKIKEINITPIKNPMDNSYYIGAWVRDSTAGIGTMTWYDPETGKYGALGHSISDVSTGNILDISKGEIVQASISGAQVGTVGSPGLLAGDFLSYEGTLDRNTESGIKGIVENAWMLPSNDAIETAVPSEVKTGPAEILCCVSGTQVEHYSVEIEKVMDNIVSGTRNMVIHITDKRLIEVTGGIVQGMSGSPVVQNGKFVGAITHVFVNDPTRGYGTFIENML